MVLEKLMQIIELIDDSILHILRSFGHRCKNVHMLKGTTNERIEQMLGFIK
jgi:hypothetical protein